jgi:hypothetical protein
VVGKIDLPLAAFTPPEAGAGRNSSGPGKLGSGGDTTLGDLAVPEPAHGSDSRTVGFLITAMFVVILVGVAIGIMRRGGPRLGSAGRPRRFAGPPSAVVIPVHLFSSSRPETKFVRRLLG